MPGEIPEAPAARGELVVLPLEDGRGERNFPSASRGFLSYVPLVPYVEFPYERLDESVAVMSEEREGATNPAPALAEYAYPASFARAIAADLRATGVFSSVAYSEEADASEARFVLRGTLDDSTVQRNVSSFGLGFLGVYLWLLPIPISNTRARVELDLRLTDAAQGGAEIWSGSLEGEAVHFYTMYHPTVQYGVTGGILRGYEMNRLPASRTLDQNSIFSWNFAALENAMAEARGQIAAAVRGAAEGDR